MAEYIKWRDRQATKNRLVTQKYTRWDDAKIEHLRKRSDQGWTAAQIAAELGATVDAIKSARRMFKISGKAGRRAGIAGWAERYGVSVRAVMKVGLERLPLMSEDARRLMFRMNSAEPMYIKRTNRRRKVTCSAARKRVSAEQKMQLVERIAHLRHWQGRAA